MTAPNDLSILIVDDYPTMVRIMRKLLKQIGYENVDEAGSGAEAIEKFKLKKYGLVISDWNMEPMTGLALLKFVRSHAENNNVPFILVTAESKSDNVVAAREAKVNGYLIKPFSAPALKDKIDSAVEGLVLA
jgi:two-component system chemotaxis response regulator CheY